MSVGLDRLVSLIDSGAFRRVTSVVVDRSRPDGRPIPPAFVSVRGGRFLCELHLASLDPEAYLPHGDR